MVEEKKRKNPWHTRKVNKLYKFFCDKIENDSQVSNKLKSLQDNTAKLSSAAKEVAALKEEYDSIVGRKVGDLINALTVETLNDSCHLERDGYLRKPLFKDFIYASSLRKKGTSIAEKNTALVSETKISQIDLVLAQIEAILSETEEK